MEDILINRLLFGQEIQVKDGVPLKVPLVKDVALNDDFVKYSSIFTIITREIFSASPNVDELEKRFPTVWSMLFDPTGEGDYILGSVLGEEDKTGSDVFIESLSFWTGLDTKGFVKLSNKKFVNKQADWVIDVAEYNRLSKIIALVTGYEPSDDFIAPKNMTPTRFAAWEAMLKGRRRMAERHRVTLADKILILSVSMESYIPIEEIGNMTYFQFCKLYEVLSEKEAYQHRWDIKVSPKFDDDSKGFKHWKEKFKIQKIMR